jgi:hypothetical protein
VTLSDGGLPNDSATETEHGEYRNGYFRALRAFFRGEMQLQS